MKKPILLVKTLVALGLFFISCDNSDDIECPEALTGELTETEVAFSGTWTLQAIVSEDEIDLTDDDVDNPSTDLYSQYSACSNDLSYTFGDDRSYTYKLGKTVSDCDVQQEVTGTWQLAENDNLIMVTGCTRQITPLSFNEDLTEFYFEATYNYTDINGNTITTNTTFTYGKSI